MVKRYTFLYVAGDTKEQTPRKEVKGSETIQAQMIHKKGEIKKNERNKTQIKENTIIIHDRTDYGSIHATNNFVCSTD